MAAISRFEDIDAWKEARLLTREVNIAICRTPLKRDFVLRDQIQRASVSIMANIAEGFDSGSNREFIRFLRYALRSTSEVQSHLYVALDREYLLEDVFRSIYEKAVAVKNLLSGFIRYLKSNRPQSTPPKR